MVELVPKFPYFLTVVHESMEAIFGKDFRKTQVPLPMIQVSHTMWRKRNTQ